MSTDRLRATEKSSVHAISWTLAPRSRAISTVRSDDPVSRTTTSSTSELRDRRHPSKKRSSLRTISAAERNGRLIQRKRHSQHPRTRRSPTFHSPNQHRTCSADGTHDGNYAETRSGRNLRRSSSQPLSWRRRLIANLRLGIAAKATKRKRGYDRGGINDTIENFS